MADLADVLDAMYGFAIGSVYPNGTGSPSIAGAPIDIAEGWPQAGDVDTAMAAGRTLAYLLPVGGTSLPEQPLDYDYGVAVEPIHGLFAVQTAENVITISGTPGVGEYLTLIPDGKAYSVIAGVGDTAATIAAAAAAAVAVDYPGTTAVGTTITVTGNNVIARIGAPGVLGQIISRQRQVIRVSVWAPNPQLRSAFAAALDIAMKRNLTFRLPDTSQALLTYLSTFWMDNEEKLGEYRRDLLYSVQYDTVDLIPAHEVTVVNISAKPLDDNGNGATLSTNV